jgi:hypothetical protein
MKRTSLLFRTLGSRGRKQLGAKRMSQQDARPYDGSPRSAGWCHHQARPHTFRPTGITVYLVNGGLLEDAQQMAAHESARTINLYARTGDEIERTMI